jgi:hypothetical protein
MATAANDPAFPARAYRLIGEARKSAARERRVLLASVLYTLPLSTTSDDDRDRLDMIFERLLPDEVRLLKAIAEFEPAAPRSPEGGIFTPRYAGTWARYVDDVLQVGPGDSLSSDVLGPNEEAAVPFIANRLAFSALGTLALVELRDQSQDFAISPHAYFAEIQQVTITPLGRLVLRALKEVPLDVEAATGWTP